MDGIRWADDQLPLGVADGDVRILVIQPCRRYLLRFYGPPKAVWAHYQAGTRPCLLPATDCPGCRQRLRRYWAGYAPAAHAGYDLETGKPRWHRCVLLVNEQQHRKLIGRYDPDAIFECWKDRGRFAPTIIRETEEQTLVPMPPAFDLRAVLLRLWHIQDGRQIAGARLPDDEPILRPYRKEA